MFVVRSVIYVQLPRLIKANSGLSVSWPHSAQGARLGQALVGLLNIMGKDAVVGLNKFRKESCLDILKW